MGVAKDAKYESLRKAAPRTMYISWIQQKMSPCRIAPNRWGIGTWRASRRRPHAPEALMERGIPEIDSALRMRFPQTFEGQ